MQIAKIDDTTFSSDELVSWLKLSGRFSHVVQDMIMEKLTATAARHKGIDVNADELQEAADNHRRVLGLHRVADANAFLDDAEVTLDGYESFIEDSVLVGKMRAELADAQAVEAYFNLNKPAYESIDVGHILVSNEDIAREVLATVAEDPDSFAELAREESIAQSAADGGRIGKVYRDALPEELAAKLFSVDAGTALGPFATADGQFEVFMVFARRDAQLDDATRESIQRRLYEDWLRSAVNDFNVEA